MKTFVAELKDAFDALPKKSYACEMTRTNKGVCFTPGKDVELAFESLLKELRTYSVRGRGAHPRAPITIPPLHMRLTWSIVRMRTEFAQKIQLGDYRKVEFNAF